MNETNESGKTVEMPIGMAMSIAQTPNAMKAFSKLSENEQSLLINKAKAVQSREEMTKLISDIVKNSTD